MLMLRYIYNKMLNHISECLNLGSSEPPNSLLQDSLLVDQPVTYAAVSIGDGS